MINKNFFLQLRSNWGKPFMFGRSTFFVEPLAWRAFNLSNYFIFLIKFAYHICESWINLTSIWIDAIGLNSELILFLDHFRSDSIIYLVHKVYSIATRSFWRKMDMKIIYPFLSFKKWGFNLALLKSVFHDCNKPKYMLFSCLTC